MRYDVVTKKGIPMKMIFRALSFAAAISLASSVLAQAGAQSAKPQNNNGNMVVRPPQTRVYNETADAKQQISTALASAKKENRRVLVQWGGNWCVWCRRLHDLTTSNKELATELRNEYDVVYIDVGYFDKNLDLAEQYGAQWKKDGVGVPYLTILDAEGKAIANEETSQFESAKEQQSGPTPLYHDRAKLKE